MTQVKKGNTIKVHYTGKLEDGSVFDSSEGRDPLEFEVGAGMMIKGFDDGVVGMNLEEQKAINIKAEEAYGDVRKDLIIDVPKAQLPAEINPEVGMELVSQQPNGQQLIVTVTAVKDDAITIDANHKLAGKDLIFDVKVVEIV